MNDRPSVISRTAKGVKEILLFGMYLSFHIISWCRIQYATFKRVIRKHLMRESCHRTEYDLNCHHFTKCKGEWSIRRVVFQTEVTYLVIGVLAYFIFMRKTSTSMTLTDTDWNKRGWISKWLHHIRISIIFWVPDNSYGFHCVPICQQRVALT